MQKLFVVRSFCVTVFGQKICPMFSFEFDSYFRIILISVTDVSLQLLSKYMQYSSLFIIIHEL